MVDIKVNLPLVAVFTALAFLVASLSAALAFALVPAGAFVFGGILIWLVV